MGDIQVTTENDRLALLQLLDIRQEGRVPVFVPQRQAAQVILGVRCVHGDHVEVLELSGEHAPFLALSRFSSSANV